MKSLSDKLAQLDKEMEVHVDIKEKLQCQGNLMKVQVAKEMKKLREKILNLTDIDIMLFKGPEDLRAPKDQNMIPKQEHLKTNLKHQPLNTPSS